jgi:hypothetical protein
MKIKPKMILWGAAIAFVGFKVLRDKVGGDCGCSGAPVGTVKPAR